MRAARHLVAAALIGAAAAAAGAGAVADAAFPLAGLQLELGELPPGYAYARPFQGKAAVPLVTEKENEIAIFFEEQGLDAAASETAELLAARLAPDGQKEPKEGEGVLYFAAHLHGKDGVPRVAAAFRRRFREDRSRFYVAEVPDAAPIVVAVACEELAPRAAVVAVEALAEALENRAKNAGLTLAPWQRDGAGGGGAANK